MPTVEQVAEMEMIQTYPNPADLVLIVGLCLLGAGIVAALAFWLEARARRRLVLTCPVCRSRIVPVVWR